MYFSGHGVSRSGHSHPPRPSYRVGSLRGGLLDIMEKTRARKSIWKQRDLQAFVEGGRRGTNKAGRSVRPREHAQDQYYCSATTARIPHGKSVEYSKVVYSIVDHIKKNRVQYSGVQ